MLNSNLLKRIVSLMLTLSLVSPILPSHAESTEYALLDGLTVKEASIAPDFSSELLYYRAEVSEDTDKLCLIPLADETDILVNDTEAESGLELELPLEPGRNTIIITCTAPEKEPVTYTLNVLRENRYEQLVEISDNITESYRYSADAWRILDMIVYSGREEAKVNLSEYLTTVSQALNSQSPSLSALSTAGLVLTALGFDITDYPINDKSVNMIESIQENTGFYNTDGSINLYNTASALYALNSADYSVSEDIGMITGNILAAQYPDGGWGFDGINGDPDTTAICVSALIPYMEAADVGQSINSALSFLSDTQCESGGYSSFGMENSNTTAMVLIALTSLGIDASSDPRFIKQGNNIIDALLTYKTRDLNGFGYTDNEYDTFATEQVYRALATYIKYLDKGKPADGFSPYNFKDYTGLVQDSAEFDANLTSLAADGIELAPAFDSAVTEYDCTTDKNSIVVTTTPQNSAAQIMINSQGNAFTVPLSTGDNTIFIDVTSENTQAEKTYVINAYRTGGGSGGSTGQTVRISIIGQNGSIILPITDVKYNPGDTAYSVLSRAAAENDIEIDTTGSGSSFYIKAIAGIYELDSGAGSGWMYSINGVFIQKSASSVTLKSGDELLWVYTQELGNDVGGGSSYGNTTETEEDTPEYSRADIDRLVLNTKSAITLESDTSVWGMFTLARLNESISSELIALIKNRLEEYSDGFRKITDAAGLILAITAAGLDPSNINGENLIAKLLNSDRMLNQGLNGPVFSLIALDGGDFSPENDTEWTRTRLVETIVDSQNTDGGFSLTESEDSNVDITAMAICALSKYTVDDKVKAVTDKAVSFLEKQQLENGGFMLYNQENCESTAQVIIALTSLGIDPAKDKRFIKSGKTLIDVLLSYSVADAKFKHLPNGQADDMSTEQALLALMAYSHYLNDKGSIYAVSVPETPVFSDALEISPWAFDSVMEANRQKLMLGSGGMFNPSASITRAELAQLLSRFFELDTENIYADFTDVEHDAWYSDAVAAVFDAGLMLGASDLTFNPNKALTREEFAVVIYRAFSLSDGDATDFTDFNDISQWARDAAGAVADSEIIMGSGGAFLPRAAVTREMAATIFVRLISLQ